MIIKNGHVFTLKNGGSFEPLTILTEEDKIVSLNAELPANFDKTEKIIDASGCYVIPGLTDIHFHGCDGYDFCDGNYEALAAISSYELKNGITDICPATMTLEKEELYRILENAAGFAAKQIACSKSAREPEADLIGIHLEGPFISPHKKGAQNGDFIQKPDLSLLASFQEKAKGLIRLITIAPEMPGALDCIREFGSKISFSVGHTEADYETAKKAMDNGALHVTHLYNAMPPFTHRAPGVIGAAADTPGCMVELICDGIHIDPAVVRATFKLFGDDNVILISDSMSATGKPDGDYSLGGQAVTVKGKLATLADGTIAGSVTNLYSCLKGAVEMGIPLVYAVKAATINPCRSIGAEKELGSIEPGKKAHFLLLDTKDLSIKAIIKGQAVI